MDRHYYPWMVNDWVHDVATGLWVATFIVIWRLSAYRFTEAAALPSGQVLALVSHEMFRLMLASLLVVTVTGVIRLRYWRNENTPDELPYKRRALLVKHALYLAIYVPGTIWAYALQR